MTSHQDSHQGASYRTLISAEDLHSIIHRRGLVILDARFDIDSEDQALVNFGQGHLPGARQADVAVHMAGAIISGVTGRRPLPEKSTFAQTIRDWGIDELSQVVIYDDMNGIMAASRLWTMLRWAGLESVALLDGGYQAWVAAGFPLDAETSEVARTAYDPNFLDHVYIHLPEIQEMSESGELLIFDSRSLSDGVPSHDAIKGHIPGSQAADRALNSAPDGMSWRSSEELRDHFRALIGERNPSDVVFYCGSGITAAQNVLGMAHAGLDGARMYVGSWSEWITDTSRAIDDSWEIGESGPVAEV
jgi:thiosulfate/3-mercaptopyruvate sulfurtransferase